jgi:non-ribosomal peptide synthetase component F
MGVTAVTEAEFTRAVIQYAQLQGWLAAHFLPAMNRRGQWRTAVQGDGKGFPDLLLVSQRLRMHPVVAAELKVGRRKPTADQERWLRSFRNAGVPAYVWTPADWSQIEEALR